MLWALLSEFLQMGLKWNPIYDGEKLYIRLTPLILGVLSILSLIIAIHENALFILFVIILIMFITFTSIRYVIFILHRKQQNHRNQGQN